MSARNFSFPSRKPKRNRLLLLTDTGMNPVIEHNTCNAFQVCNPRVSVTQSYMQNDFWGEATPVEALGVVHRSW